jgi:VWFA-related protein
MVPDMSATDIAFTRRTGPITEMLQRNWTWGVRGQIAGKDPEEQLYESCYPDAVAPGATAPPVSRDPTQPAGTPAGMYEGGRVPVKPVAQEMIDRRREKRTLDALTDLAVFLRGVREERKAVIVVSDGWALYRPDERLTRLRSGERVPGTGLPGTDPQGRLVSDAARARGTIGDGGMYECEVARQRLAMIDNRQTYMDLMEYANRGNVSFYPVDSRGLPVFDTDLGEKFVTPGGNLSVLPPSTDQRLLGQRIETLQTLAANTDGIAVVNRNDIERGLERVVADLSSYYLMSYYSSNGALDGKYRQITVRVKRPGVEVRARKGYRAATAEEMTSSAAAPGAPTAVQAAFAQLGTARADLPLRSHVAWVTSAGGARVFPAVELDARTVKQAEWGGSWRTEFTLTDAKGTKVLARGAADGAGLPPSRAEAVLTPEAGLGAGDYLLRARVVPAQSGLPLTDSVRFSVPAEPSPVGTPMFARRNATTGRAYVRTSDLRFRRTDWLRLALPIAEAPASVTGELVDQRGQVMAIPVTTRAEGGEAGETAVAELSLAPLATGEYAVRIVVDIGGVKHERLAAFRVVT